MESRKEAKKEIKKLIKSNGNKILMGLVHHTYGPLRGLNFQIENPNVDEILDAIDSQMNPPNEEYLMESLEKIDRLWIPDNIIDLNLKTWKLTLLSVQLMILPNELLEQAENTPETYSNLKEAIIGVNQSLILTEQLQKKDPFFFRSGII